MLINRVINTNSFSMTKIHHLVQSNLLMLLYALQHHNSNLQESVKCPEYYALYRRLLVFSYCIYQYKLEICHPSRIFLSKTHFLCFSFHFALDLYFQNNTLIFDKTHLHLQNCPKNDGHKYATNCHSKISVVYRGHFLCYCPQV